MLTLPVFSFKNFALGNLMKYAVIRTGGKQYRVSEGDLVKVEKLAGEVGEKVTLPDVLFVGGNDDVKIGSPLVANAKVTGEIVGQIRAKKSWSLKRSGVKAIAASAVTDSIRRL